MRRYSLTYLARCAVLKVPPATVLDGDKHPPAVKFGHHKGDGKTSQCRWRKPRPAEE